MSSETKNRRVPSLRFPGFEDKGEWEEKTLEQISPAIFDGTHQTPKYTKEGTPFFSVENLISGNKNKFISREDYLIATSKNKPEKDDILITRIGNIGFSKIVDWDYEFSIYVTLAVVKKSEQFESNYLHSYFQSDYYQKEIKSKSLLNAVPSKINMDELRKTKILLPPDKEKKEQQKLAGCFSSLDEYLTTQSQKLEALKAHKKGLMQQLFPVEGESMPKLRFPGFKCKWNVEPLGEVYSFKTTNSFSRENLNYEKGDVKNIHYGDIHTKFSTLFDIKNERVPFINPSVSINKINSECYCIEGDMIFADASEDLNDVGKSIELVTLNNERLLAGLHTLLARQKEAKLVVGFGGYLFKSDGIRTQIKRESQGAKVLGISASRLSNVKIYFPEDKIEQQKIANCLSFLDQLITAHTEKVEEAKRHKKGLMQRLFPNTNNIENG